MSNDGSPKIRLVLFWHMHQPFYKDMVTGEYRLPWVRLHALKDYYGMVKLLDEFPDVHQNFNLVPSLVTQIQDYVSGQAHDPFLNVVAKPAEELTPSDRHFALQYLFQANPVNMIGRYPRYRELWERYRSTVDRPEGPDSYFVTRDYADLQVLSQLAWFDEYFLAEPDIAALVEKGEDFTLADQQLVIARERELLAKVLPAYADAAGKGSIELSASPFYHPILPLLCDTNVGAQSSPGLNLPTRRFRHPDDASLQIQRALDSHEALFGVRSKGLWPSEGSVSEETLTLAYRRGIQWMATDEGVLGRSLDFHLSRHDGEKLQAEGAERLYNIYLYEKDGTRMHLVFRDHHISDLIGFVYSGMAPQEAATHLIQNIKDSAQPVLQKGKDAVVSIILDGENAWEYYPQSGREFLRRFYDAVQRDSQIEPVTITEAIARHKSSDFGHLTRLVPGSWINANLDVWIGSPEDNRSWDLLAEARDYYDRYSHRVSAEQRKLAWEELLIAEGSDWNWWYGPEHHSANDRDFDELYRKHLSNVYHALEGIPPEELGTPIISGVVRPSYLPQTAYVRARVDGLVSGYFEWMGAASFTADQRSMAMHGKQFLLDAVYAGVDADSVSGRLDFHHSPPEGAYRLVVNVEVRREEADRKSPVSSYRLTADVQGQALQKWVLTNGEERRKLAGFSAGNGDAPANGVEVALADIFEFRLPFELIGVQQGSRIRLRFSIWREHLPVDSMPLEGWIDLAAQPEAELESNLFSVAPPE
jgi:alpha-amylase/alpha-mannosidase (GH57 family)